MKHKTRNDRTGENDAETRTLTLSERDIEAAQRLLSALASAGYDLRGASGLPVDPAARRLRKATAALERRQARTKFFSRSMVGEPAFDILLALYLVGQGGQAVPVSKLAQLADVPLSTATRWLGYLENNGLVIRQKDNVDKRVSLASLSERGSAKLDEFFDTFDV